MGVFLALASAFCYGVSDFTGGLLSRRSSAIIVAFFGQVGALLLALATTLVIPASEIRISDLAWGALSGIGTAIGTLFLLRGLTRGEMSVVVPLTAVCGLALPIPISVLVLSERPSLWSWIGFVVTVPAIWMIARTNSGAGTKGGVPEALIASVGIAVQYLALAQAAPQSGAWPLVAGRVAGVLTVLAPIALSHSRPALPTWRIGWLATAIGAIAGLALACYLLAVRQQLVSVAVVLSSFYPVLPVLLGVVFLRERPRPQQLFGLAGAAVAIALLTL